MKEYKCILKAEGEVCVLCYKCYILRYIEREESWGK